MAQKKSGDDTDLWIAVLLGGAFIALVVFWDRFAPDIYYRLLYVSWYEALPFASFPFMGDFQQKIAQLNPSSMNIWQMNGALNAAGRWCAWLLAPFCCFLVIRGIKASAAETYTRNLNMQGLLNNNAKLYPCLAPILNWGKPIIREDMDKGPWMTARQPIQFAAEKGLLADMETGRILEQGELLTNAHIANPDSPVIAGAIKARFLRDKAKKEFEGQFSGEFAGFLKMPPYLRALGTAFLLMACGRTKDCQRILDNMSTSFRPPRKATPARLSLKPPFFIKGKSGRKGYAINTDTGISAKEVMALFEREDVQLYVRPHNRYVNHVILALYMMARKKGVLSTAEFIWLRPVNRKLFYMLNNYGRRTAWTEIAGAWAHFEAESALGNADRKFQGRDIPEEDKIVDKAVNALELAMYEEGWIGSLALDKKAYGLAD